MIANIINIIFIISIHFLIRAFRLPILYLQFLYSVNELFKYLK